MYLGPYVGYRIFLLIAASCNIFSLILLFLMKVKPKWTKREEIVKQHSSANVAHRKPSRKEASTPKSRPGSRLSSGFSGMPVLSIMHTGTGAESPACRPLNKISTTNNHI
jgi:hypothetical protein